MADSGEHAMPVSGVKSIAGEARKRGLLVGLNNDLDQVAGLVDDFDFAVDEQCHQFSECSLLQPFIDAGKPVFNAEYPKEMPLNPTQRNQLCTDSLSQNLRTLLLPLNLDDSSRDRCDETPVAM